MSELKGRPVQIGEATYVVPRITVEAYFRLKEEADGYAGDGIALLVSQILGVLARNYPDLTREKFLSETQLELADLADAHVAVLEAAKKKKDAAVGEAASP